MFIQPRRAQLMVRRPGPAAGARAMDRGGPGRLVTIILALYLTPALLIVLVVGALGMLVLAVARAITSMRHGPEAWPRGPVGPESSAG